MSGTKLPDRRPPRPILPALRALALGALALCALAGCGLGGRPALHPVRGLLPRLAFTLDDANTGAQVNARSFAGKVVLLYFGYTHCPDVCPATLTKLAAAVRALGPGRAAAVRILFVSVDPRRDTVTHLRTYAAAFGPEVVALRGTKPQIDALAARYRVTYGFGAPDAAGDYDVRHSSAVFVFDATGHARLLAEPAAATTDITAELGALLGTIPECRPAALGYTGCARASNDPQQI